MPEIPSKLENLKKFHDEYSSQYIKHIEYKTESVEMRVLSVLLKPINDKFMTNYTTVIGDTVYFPSKKWLETSERRALNVLAHEATHGFDMENGRFFNLKYLFPQILVFLSLFSLLSIWFSNFFLLSLVFLFCALPIPSIYRARLEARGYATTVKMNQLLGTNTESVEDQAIDYVKYFVGSKYYYMYPFYKKSEELIVESYYKLGKDVFPELDKWFKQWYKA